MTRHILWISASIVWFDFLARECDSLKFTLFFPYFFLFFVPFLTKRFVHLESSCMTRHIFWISASIVRFDFFGSRKWVFKFTFCFLLLLKIKLFLQFWTKNLFFGTFWHHGQFVYISLFKFFERIRIVCLKSFWLFANL